MSLKDRVLDVLKPMHECLSAIEHGVSESTERLRRIETKLDRVIAVFVDSQDQADAFRARVLEQAARDGHAVERHELTLANHETRLHRLEDEQDDAAE